MKLKEENYVLLDIRGLLLHSLNRGTDADAKLGSDGKSFNRWNYGIDVFIESYLLQIFELVAPRNVIAVWDDNNSYRSSLYPKYKANRVASREKESPEVQNNRDQLQKAAKKLLASLGVTQVMVPNTEADDVIAFFNARLGGMKAIFTVDADLLAMASQTTKVFLKGEMIEGEHNGMPVELTTLYKSLVGDSSDNYSGVPRIGEAKAWPHLITEFGLDGMLELQQCVATRNYSVLEQAIRETDDAVLKQIYKNRDTWELMWHLASLHPEICDTVRQGKPHKPRYYKRLPDSEKLMAVLNAAGCPNYFDKLKQWMPVQWLVTDANKSERLKHFKNQLCVTPFVSFDYESYDSLGNQAYQDAANGRAYVDVLSQKVTGASFTYGENMQYTIYVSVFHKDTDNVDMDVLRWVLDTAEESHTLAVQNANFENVVTNTNLGRSINTPEDTRIMAAYVDEEGDNGLKSLSKSYLNYDQTTYKEVIGDKAGMHELTGEEVLQYGCDDAWVTASLRDLLTLILKTEQMHEFATTNEYEVAHPLDDAFIEGVRIDFDRLKELEEEDALIVKEGMGEVRRLLAENCTTQDKARADNLYYDLEAYTVASLRADEKDDETIKEKLEAMAIKFFDESKYRPYVEVKKEVKFTPTDKGLTKVAHHIGLPKVVELTGVTANKVSEFMVNLSDYRTRLEQIGAPEQDIINEFCNLLADSVEGNQLRNREGDKFDSLMEFCLNALADTAGSEWLGDELNFGSPIQQQILLYVKLGLPIRVRSKVQTGSGRDRLGFEGGPATDETAVQMALAEDAPEGDWRRPVLENILAVKGAMTRFGLYYKPYPLWREPGTDVIHPFIRNCGTVTNRPSGSSPNLLQVSKKDGGKIRSCIRTRRDDHVIISPDFSGQELRIMTSESKDEVLLDAYIGPVKKDIHSVTAAGIAPVFISRAKPGLMQEHGWILTSQGGMQYDDYLTALKGDDRDIADLMDKIRKVAKAVNFLIIYGGGPTTLARNLGIPVEMAKEFMQQVFKAYPGIAPWQESVIRFARENGYVLTAYGNRRHAPANLFSKDDGLRGRAERQLVNSPIQGTAADILKVVLRECHETKLFKETGAVLIAPVYDEVTSSVPKAAAVEYIERLTSIMELTPPGHQVPMVAEVEVGRDNWGAQSDYNPGGMIELGASPSADAILAACEGRDLAKEAA